MSNFPGDYIAGTDSNDYTDDLEGRMVIHRCSLVLEATTSSMS